MFGRLATLFYLKNLKDKRQQPGFQCGFRLCCPKYISGLSLKGHSVHAFKPPGFFSDADPEDDPFDL